MVHYNFTTALIHYLVLSFRPLLWLHSQERYYPASIEHYINHSQLVCNGTLLATPMTLDRASLMQHTQPYDLNECYLTPQRAIQRGFHTQVADAPFYAHHRLLEHGRVLEVRYVFFYAYNGPFELLRFFRYLHVNYGAHDGDFEHVTLQFERRPNGHIRLARMYFGAHTSQEGVWRTPQDIQWPRKGAGQLPRPYVYVAHGSHANYPHEGIFVRLLGIVNDYCDRGTLWDPLRVIVLNDAADTWHRYTGRFSMRSPGSGNTLRAKTWGDPHPETNVSTSAIERMFYLYPDNFGTL